MMRLRPILITGCIILAVVSAIVWLLFDAHTLLRGRELTASEKGYLGRWYGEEDLNYARVHDGLPLFVKIINTGLPEGHKIKAITLKNDIFIKTGDCAPETAERMGLLGHEMLHLQRYREGMTIVGYLKACFPDRDCEYEVEAGKREADIMIELHMEKGLKWH